MVGQQTSPVNLSESGRLFHGEENYSFIKYVLRADTEHGTESSLIVLENDCAVRNR